MSKHTAAEVNRLITHLDPTRTETMMLHAYADLLAAQEKAEPDCYAVLTPNGSKLVSPEEAKGLLQAYPLYAHPPVPPEGAGHD